MAKELTDDNASIEAINAWIHFIAFLVSIPAGIALARLASSQETGLWISCIVYAISLSAMYLFSALSHAVRDPEKRHRMRSLDQGIIYTLIAGTFTPFIWSQMNGWPRFALLSGVWIAALAGFYSKVLTKHRVDNMTAVTYILLGWVPSMVLYWSTSYWCFAMMLLGGLLYTIGVLFLQNDHKAWYFHPVWHLMVVLASACHFAGIAMFAVLHWDRV
jgi:hemolysin III